MSNTNPKKKQPPKKKEYYGKLIVTSKTIPPCVFHKSNPSNLQPPTR